MIRVLINGCNGNMGKELTKYIETTNDFFVLCGVDRKNNTNTKFPIFTDVSIIKEKPDIIIDFSTPEASINILNFAKSKQIPIVIATTGFSNNQIEFIKHSSKYIPIFKSANMSLEVSIMNILVAKLSKLLSDCDIEIVETHHRNKKDAPSGTALMLASSINSAQENKFAFTYGRNFSTNKRSRNEIGIHSIRGGTEVGKHSVLFLGNDETFELTHSAYSRSIFAKGALLASKFLINKSAGFYEMKDLLQFT